MIAARKSTAKSAVAALAAGLGLALFGQPALAQDSAAQGLRIWKDKGQCAFCHGWAGDGHGDAHSEGKAPSLRETKLTRDQIYETIKCGRPGTAMPHFDKFAYTDKRYMASRRPNSARTFRTTRPPACRFTRSKRSPTSSRRN